MNLRWLLSSILFLHLVSLSGCSLFQEKVVVQKQNLFLPIVCPDPPKPAPIATRKIEPRAVIDKAGLAWVGLTPQHYENLAINTQETIRYIKSQNGNITYYQTCIVDFNLKIKELEAKEDEQNDGG